MCSTHLILLFLLLPLSLSILGASPRSIQCSNCQSIIAEYGCDKCENESFCLECYKTVHASRVMQKHRQVPMTEQPLQIMLCGTHSDEKLKYWCDTCKILVCTACILLEHKSHQYDLIDKTAKEFEIKVSHQIYQCNCVTFVFRSLMI
jgi:tripartite motif-containing protein 56